MHMENRPLQHGDERYPKLSCEPQDSSRKLMIFTPRRNKTLDGENQLLFFSFFPLWRRVRTVAKSMRKREDMLITVEQPQSPRREGAGEAGSGHGGGKLNGPDGQVTLWTKSPLLARWATALTSKQTPRAQICSPLSAAQLSSCGHGFLFPHLAFF